jgi:hypothetical protein
VAVKVIGWQWQWQKWQWQKWQWQGGSESGSDRVAVARFAFFKKITSVDACDKKYIKIIIKNRKHCHPATAIFFATLATHPISANTATATL